MQRNHEYIVIYRKTTEFVSGTQIKSSIKNTTWNEKTIFEDNQTYYYLSDPITTRGEGGTLNKRPNLGYTVYFNPNTTDFIAEEDYNKDLAKVSNDSNTVYKDNKDLIAKGYVAIRPPEVRGKLGCWTWSIDKFNQEKNSLIITGKRGAYTVRKRVIVSPEKVIKENGKLIYRFFSESNSRSIIEFSTSDGTNSLNELMGFQGAFDNPKNVEMIEYLIGLIPNKDFTILDFFAGSSTTAHAVMKVNSKDGGKRKFIQCQLPVVLDENQEAFKQGFKNISDLGKKRISLAAQKLASETDKQIDFGFRVYRLDDSNMQDVYYRPQDYSQNNLELFADNIKSDRNGEDLLAQVMLDWGLPLSLKIEHLRISGKLVFKVAADSLMACFDKGIDEAFAKEIAQHKPLRIVFRDASFKDDTAKENVKQLLKQLSPDTEMRVI